MENTQTIIGITMAHDSNVRLVRFHVANNVNGSASYTVYSGELLIISTVNLADAYNAYTFAKNNS